MSEYVESSISKGERYASAARDALTNRNGDGGSSHIELRHGAWISKARERLRKRRFSTPLFLLLVVFVTLFVGSVFLFEHLDVVTGPMYAGKIILTSLFAITLGFLLSIWWSTDARVEEKIKEAERIDVEYRELLMSFSDSLFDIINALNTLADKPPRPFVIATEFLLGEYVHLLQSRLQRYGDYIAGLGFDATAFLDEKRLIFEGIRERASLSIQGMPKELETLFAGALSLDVEKFVNMTAQRQARLRGKLKELSENEGEARKAPATSA